MPLPSQPDVTRAIHVAEMDTTRNIPKYSITLLESGYTLGECR